MFSKEEVLVNQVKKEQKQTICYECGTPNVLGAPRCVSCGAVLYQYNKKRK